MNRASAEQDAPSNARRYCLGPPLSQAFVRKQRRAALDAGPRLLSRSEDIVHTMSRSETGRATKRDKLLSTAPAGGLGEMRLRGRSCRRRSVRQRAALPAYARSGRAYRGALGRSSAQSSSGIGTRGSSPRTRGSTTVPQAFVEGPGRLNPVFVLNNEGPGAARSCEELGLR